MPIKNLFEEADFIGVIGSPSSTGELTLDIIGTAVTKGLVGKLSVFKYMQDDYDNYALGQITEIEMRNVWTQDPTMRGIIRQRGRVDPITEKQDTHIAKMRISSVFALNNEEIQPSIFGTVPSTGTQIKLLDDKLMKAMFKDYEQELFYLGTSYGTNIKMPMWFKHFGTGKSGAGEAYHIGVFGKTGSGKSVLSKMILLGYARHPEMSIFILDPQGEFARDFKEHPELKNVVQNNLKRNVSIFNLNNIVLSNWKLFEKILVDSEFFFKLGVKHVINRTTAADQAVKILRSKKKDKSKIESFTGDVVGEVKLSEVYKRESFNKVWNALGEKKVQERIYSSKDAVARIQGNYESDDPDEYYSIWQKVANLFKYQGRSNSINTYDLAKKISDNSKNIIIIDLSESEIPSDVLWNESIRLMLIGEFIKTISKEAELKFKENKLLNSLIIIDEAHRLAPRETPENEELVQIKANLIDGVRTTRKYGLGWMFISQTLSSLDRKILEQMRVYLFGYGLAWGVELQALKGLIGGAEDAIRLYQMFVDPQSGLGKQEYPFMSIGPISPLSFSGTPLFFKALDYPKEFLEINFDG